MKATLLTISDLAGDVRQFRFVLREVDRFEFVPGQFVSMSGPVGERIVTRAYTICSRPGDSNEFELCLNRVKEGLFSPFLFEMRPGDTVETRGPFGFFTLRNRDADMIMVATGTGIAPFRPMLHDYLLTGGGADCTLIFGVRTEDRILYRTEFERLEREHPNFHFWPTLTRPDAEWQGRRGRVQEHLMQFVGERRDIDVYACGLKEMTDSVRTHLKAAGFDRKRIIIEKYD